METTTTPTTTVGGRPSRVRRRLPRAAMLATSVIAALALTACGGSGSTTHAVTEPGGYAFEQAQRVQSEVSTYGPSTLVETLTNRTIALTEGEAARFSDQIVIGSISRVEHAEAIQYDESNLVDDEPQARTAGWDDPAVDERSLSVTLTDVHSLTGATVDDELTFRLGVPTGADPDEFEASVRTLTSVVVPLQIRPDGRHQGEWIPALGPAGIGTVDADGTVHFPGMGAREARFIGDLATVEKITAAATAE